MEPEQRDELQNKAFDMLSFFTRKLEKDIANYSLRKVDRIDPEDNGGIGVSTAITTDEGFETALLTASEYGPYPVERYKSRDKALEGHNKWVTFARHYNGEPVLKLGVLGGDDTVVYLKRVEKKIEEK